MKTRIFKSGNPSSQSGFTLLMVLAFATITFLVLGAALSWCRTNVTLNERNNQYYQTAAAAEAATEKLLAHVTHDYQLQGESLVWAKMDTYRQMVPTSYESPAWASYTFNDAQGNEMRTYIQRLASASYVPLQSKYQGIYGLASSYRIVSNARMLGRPYDLDVGVKQEVQLASIPVFQFAIFYSMDLEINPGPNMTVNGRVHGNANIYTQPVRTLTFQSDVTAAGELIPGKHPNDPSVRNTANSQVVYQAEHDANVSTLTLPIGTNNSPQAVRAIVDVPSNLEPPSSLMGQQRYYNKADMVVLVTDSGVTVKSGLFDHFGTSIPQEDWELFLNTDASFYDKRERKTIHPTEVDVGKLRVWSQTNQVLRPFLGRDVRSVYVSDQRFNSSTHQSAVRVKNAQTLPDLGLTVATPNPMYVWGHFNAPTPHLGTTDTSLTKPASLVADSINILSVNWNDANSASRLRYRVAGNTTVNAALLSGIVPSGNGRYSGGVENFPRFLEKWSGKTLAYNGSMVVMFYSAMATAPWGSSDVYSPPVRQWTFDLNFLDPTKLPPGTPEVRALIRGQWAMVEPNSVN